MILHGIYGQGGNWRGWANRLLRRCPGWGALLVDLRMHGRSQGAPPPHTVAACAEDLVAVLHERSASGQPVAGVLGHSFGGKVALELRNHVALPTWVIDSSPGARPEFLESAQGSAVKKVLECLESAPAHFSRRDDFVEYLLGNGLAEPVAKWMAMNLESDGTGYRLTLDPAAMRALLSDYFRVDSWPRIIECHAPVRVAVATRDSSIAPDDQRKLERLSEEMDHLQIRRVESGHWMHVEAPEALAEHVAADLKASVSTS